MINHIEILSDMIKFNTISKKDDPKENFDEFHLILKNGFTNIHKALEFINIDENLILKWNSRFNDSKHL